MTTTKPKTIDLLDAYLNARDNVNVIGESANANPTNGLMRQAFDMSYQHYVTLREQLGTELDKVDELVNYLEDDGK